MQAYSKKTDDELKSQRYVQGAVIGVRQKYDGLHGLRGVAAVCVMIAHFSWFVSAKLVPQAHVAVDLFFMLSGFVIAHAYDRRLIGGMSSTQFFVARMKRLYPLYLFSIVFAILSVPVIVFLGGQSYSRTDLLVSSVSALLLLPTVPKFSADGSLFPLNGPAWSLFWELVINIVFALIATRLNKRSLQAVVALSAAWFCCVGWHYGGLGGGAYWREGPTGISRVCFAFFAGVYLRRHVSLDGKFETGQKAFWLALILSLTGMLITAPAGSGWLFDIITVVFVWPVVIILASRSSLTGLLRRAAHLSGEASYGIYVLHIPMILLLSSVWTHLNGRSITQLPMSAVPVMAFLIVGTALAAHLYYDIPVRARLTPQSNRSDVQSEVVQF